MSVRMFLLVAAVVIGALAPAAPAAAHGGGAAFEVLEADEVAPGKVSLHLAITFDGDGDAASGAIVDVVATSPGGVPSPGVRLERDAADDTYAGVLDLGEPGRWTLAVTSSFPPGSTEVPVEVGGAARAAAEGVAAEDPSGTPATGGLEEPEAGGAEGGSDTTNLVVAAVSGVIGGALGLWVSRRRSARRRAAPPD